MTMATAESSNTQIIVDVLAGSVTKNDTPIAFGWRERIIVMALAVYPKGLSAERLAGLVFPDGNVAGPAGLRVYIHRLRRRVSEDFIVSRERIYTLGGHVRNSLGEPFDRPVSSAQLHVKNPEELERLRLHARALRAPVRPELEDYDWYVSYAAKQQRIGRELALVLSREMAERKDFLEAIRIATELTFEDPCDEEAWHQVIRAQLAIGQRSAALHGFRFLQSALERDLGTKPSLTLNALLSM